MIDIVKALRVRAQRETSTGITEPKEHIDWMAVDEIERLREENARLREELEAFKKFERERWTGWAARAAIREGGKDG